jgi:hypothetical protein
MKSNCHHVLFLAALPLLLHTAALAGEPRPGLGVPGAGSYNLGINYPGAALRYFVADGKALELFGQGQDRIFTGGVRYYRYLGGLARAPLSPYLAGEAEYVSFKGKYSKGGGWGGGAYAGVEYRLSRSVSLQTDLGALYISVKDKDTSLIESGMEFVLNLGFNIYFGGGRP